MLNVILFMIRLLYTSICIKQKVKPDIIRPKTAAIIEKTAAIIKTCKG